MEEDAEERNNTGQKEKESDEKEGKGAGNKSCREVGLARRENKEITGLVRESQRVCFQWNSRGGNQAAVGSGMRRR